MTDTAVDRREERVTMGEKSEAEKRTEAVIDATIAELAKLGHPANVNKSSGFGSAIGIVFDDGIDVRVSVGHGAGSKWRLIVGAYGYDRGRRNFPEPKTGFRIQEAAALVWRLAEDRRAKNAIEDREERAFEEAARINSRLGIVGDSPCAATDGHGNLVLRSRATGTADQITHVLRAAIEAGVAKTRTSS